MLKKTIEDAINKQINAELYSSYLYFSMAAWAQDKNLNGFAHWLHIQTEEERLHALKMFQYVYDRGGRVILQPIEGPRTDWDSPLAVMEHVATHEAHVSMLINQLLDMAIKESDHATSNFLQWFVAEQVEEEANADAIVKKLTLMQGAPGGLYILDQELAGRSMSPEMVAMRIG